MREVCAGRLGQSRDQGSATFGHQSRKVLRKLRVAAVIRPMRAKRGAGGSFPEAADAGPARKPLTCNSKKRSHCDHRLKKTKPLLSAGRVFRKNRRRTRFCETKPARRLATVLSPEDESAALRAAWPLEKTNPRRNPIPQNKANHRRRTPAASATGVGPAAAVPTGETKDPDVQLEKTNPLWRPAKENKGVRPVGRLIFGRTRRRTRFCRTKPIIDGGMPAAVPTGGTKATRAATKRTHAPDKTKPIASGGDYCEPGSRMAEASGQVRSQYCIGVKQPSGVITAGPRS